MRNRRRIALTLVIGAALTALLFAPVDFAPGFVTPVKVFMVLLVWLFISYGVWSFAAWPSAIRDLASVIGPRPPAPARSSVEAIAASKTLDPADAAALDTMVATLARHGVFAPRVPDPALLHPGVADYGDVSPEAVFSALSELHYYHPAIPDDAFMANLAFAPSHGEQGVEALAGQIADIDRLTSGALGIDGEAIRWPADVRATDVELDLRINNAPLRLRWRAAAKYLSTVPHVALAQAYRRLATGQRLASVWTDEGLWLMRLPDGAVTALARDGVTGFGWLDEQAPVAAGDA